MGWTSTRSWATIHQARPATDAECPMFVDDRPLSVSVMVNRVSGHKGRIGKIRTKTGRVFCDSARRL